MKLPWRKEPICEHEECYECHHLIAKGTGQRVQVGYSGEEYIYCDLHKKPYDRIHFDYSGLYSFEPCEIRYEKAVYPWKRVNEDGSDYKEPKKSK